MEFKYFYITEASDAIDIENLGNCFIEAYNDFGAKFYLWIQTDLGFSKILEAGPYVDDGKISCKECALSFTQTSFTEPKMIKKIESFLNTVRYHITQAINKQDEYTLEEKISKLYNIVEYMKKE